MTATTYIYLHHAFALTTSSLPSKPRRWVRGANVQDHAISAVHSAGLRQSPAIPAHSLAARGGKRGERQPQANLRSEPARHAHVDRASGSGETSGICVGSPVSWR